MSLVSLGNIGKQSSMVSRILVSANNSLTGGKKEHVADFGGVVRSGYLVKLATKSKLNWKKRFFVLHENNLKYFTDHLSTTEACKGDFHLTANTTVTEIDKRVAGKDYCLLVRNESGEELIVSGKDAEDQKAWKDAIETSINRTKNSIRGYAMKLDQFDDKPLRKYFILHDGMLSYHKDDQHTGAIQGMITLSSETKVQVSDEMCALSLTDPEKNRLILQFHSNISQPNQADEYLRWKTAILAVCTQKITDNSQTESVRIEKALETNNKQGNLRVRPPHKGAEIWDDRYFILTRSELLQLSKLPDGTGKGSRIIETFKIHPSCSVFETNLGPCAFELVTSEKVLHVMGESKDVTNSWMTALRDAIFHSLPEADDPLLQAALLKIESDIFYTVTFREDKPLGVVLERTGEWAVVKLSNFKDTGVYIGSALVSVNDNDVTLFTYQATIEKLKNWKPPLKLGFRKAPHKQGYLVKQARSTARGAFKKTWTQRYFVLDEGRLMYKETDATELTLKGDFPLMGSAVSLVSEEETGRPNCFRLVSGVTCLIMNANSYEDMMDWAATLYHAIAIANGGAHLLSLERDKKNQDEAKRIREEEEAKKAQELALRLAEEKKREEEELRSNEASKLLTTAMEQDDLDTLMQAIEAVEAMNLVESLPLLDDAKAKHKALLNILSIEAAELQLEADITDVKKDLSAEHLEALALAIECAKRSGVAPEKIEESSVFLTAMKLKKNRSDEVLRMLKFAIMYKSIAGLKEAISAAEENELDNKNHNNESDNNSSSYNNNNTEILVLEEARTLLIELEAEQIALKVSEDERLAKEAADLDEQLTNDNDDTSSTTNTSLSVTSMSFDENNTPFSPISERDNEDNDDDEDGESSSNIRPADSPSSQSETKSATGYSGRKWSVSKAPNKYTIMEAQKKAEFSQSSRFILGRQGDGGDDEEEQENLPSIDSVRDEDIGKVFEAFSRRSSSGTINPMQFSTIWRMLTGDKGNLFQEMQLFHKFDANNNGALACDEFVAGWRQIASQPGGERLLRKIK
eukprot:gene9074-18797_t